MNELLRAISALGLTIALIGLCAFMVQKLGRFHLNHLVQKGTKRLNVVEFCPIDGRHRLCLIKRDNTEHLLLLSPQAPPLVIEQNIDSSSLSLPQEIKVP